MTDTVPGAYRSGLAMGRARQAAGKSPGAQEPAPIPSNLGVVLHDALVDVEVCKSLTSAKLWRVTADKRKLTMADGLTQGAARATQAELRNTAARKLLDQWVPQ